MHELNEEIGKLLAKAEQLGAEGNVDEAQKVLQEVEKVRTKKKDAEVRTSHTHTQGFGVFIDRIVPAHSKAIFYMCRRNTGTLCLLPVSNSRSSVCVRFALPIWVSMTTIAALLTILVGNCIWASSRSEKSWSS